MGLGAGRGVAAALALGIVLTGCSDEPEPPGTLPTNLSTPSSSSSSPEPSPDTPAEEVEAAVRFYYAELTRAAQTNDTSTLRTLSTKGCPCYRPVRVIDRGAKRGEITPDAEWTIRSLRVHDIEGGIALADVKYDVSAYAVINEDGEVLGRVKAQSSHLDLSLVLSDDRWIIGNVFDLES